MLCGEVGSVGNVFIFFFVLVWICVDEYVRDIFMVFGDFFRFIDLIKVISFWCRVFLKF